MDENNKQDYNRRTGLEYTEPTPDPEPEPETTSNYAPSHIHTPDIVSSVLDHFGAIVASVLAIIVIALFIWLFTPITRTATIQSFNWNRSIDVETWEGPLGTPLGLVHWKRASSPVEAGTSGFL